MNDPDSYAGMSEEDVASTESANRHPVKSTLVYIVSCLVAVVVIYSITYAILGIIPAIVAVVAIVAFALYLVVGYVMSKHKHSNPGKGDR